MSQPNPVPDPLEIPNRASKPLLPIWGDYSAAVRAAAVDASNHPKPVRHTAANAGWVEYQKLMDAVWPDRGPEVTFDQVLQRAIEQRREYEAAWRDKETGALGQ